MNTILLTGATGFLGSHLLSVLLKKQYNIIILKRSFSNTERINKHLDSPYIKSYDIDNTNIENIFIENKIDIIIHCATEYGRRCDSSYNVLQTNLMLPIKLLENAVKYDVSTFINTDSYFNKENLSYSFLLNYSLSKKSLNLWLKYFSKKIKVINLILEHIYGEYDNPNKFIENMIQQIAIKNVSQVNLTPGEQKRDFIYVKDACDAYIATIEYANKNNFRYREFDIGTGIKTSLKDFVQSIKEISNSQTVLNFGGVNYREDEIMCSVADITELSTLLDVQKFKKPIDGIKEILSCYKGGIN